MASFLNTLMMVMNYMNGQEINGTAFVGRIDQVQCRVELVIPAQNLIEEFSITHDRTLNLTRYEYSLDSLIAPYFTASSRKSIVDFNTGVTYDMDSSSGSCNIRYDKLDAEPSKVTTHSLLKMMSPEQLFSVNGMMRFVEKSSVRGMEADVWSADIDKFFLAGYGYRKTRHTLYTLSSNATKYYKGASQTGVFLQRTVQLIEPTGMLSSPVVVLNYFDLYIPQSTQMFDYNVMSCSGVSAAEVKEEILIRFNGKLASNNDLTVTNFRKTAWETLASSAGVSPLRSLGNFWSDDDSSTYFTTVLLPRSNRTGLFKSLQKNATVRFFGYGKQNAVDQGSSATEMGFEGMVESCAQRCLENESCSNFAFCPDNSKWKMFSCIIEPVVVGFMPIGGQVLNDCLVYKEKRAWSTNEPDSMDALTRLAVAINDRSLKLTVGNITLLATELRKNVSLLSSTKGEKVPETFTLYKALSNLAGSAVRLAVGKLNSKQCMERCKNEKNFICQSISICGYGDCILSDLHGDELASPGSSYISNHSHCGIWSRIWTSDFQKIPSTAFPQIEADQTMDFAVSEETCAKQCSFPAGGEESECESFVWCPSTALLGREQKSACTLFKHHVFDRPNEQRSQETSLKNDCQFYTKNYADDFQESLGIAFKDNADVEILEYQIDSSFSKWKCAKKCLDVLGDDRCFSTELCRDPDSTSKSTKCRVSTLFIEADRHSITNSTVSNPLCIVQSRYVHLDGTKITARSSAPIKVSKLERRADRIQICMSGGYTAGEMALLAFCMLLLGSALVLAVVLIVRKFVPVSDFGFVRFSNV